MGVCQTGRLTKYHGTSHGYGGTPLGQHRSCWPYGVWWVLAWKAFVCHADLPRGAQSLADGPSHAGQGLPRQQIKISFRL